jgi:hypothetical protein
MLWKDFYTKLNTIPLIIQNIKDNADRRQDYYQVILILYVL